MGHPDVKAEYERPDFSPNNCPVMERTGDGRLAGRCWFWLGANDTCPRHGKINFRPTPPKEENRG